MIMSDVDGTKGEKCYDQMSNDSTHDLSKSHKQSTIIYYHSGISETFYSCSLPLQLDNFTKKYLIVGT